MSDVKRIAGEKEISPAGPFLSTFSQAFKTTILQTLYAETNR